MKEPYQNVEPYSAFSEIYSHLMRSVDYNFWAEYIGTIHDSLGKKEDVALELAAGNGKLSEILTNEFKEIYVSDISAAMLKKNSKCKNKVCCDMLNLPFKKKFDFIFSTFDSVNYLNSEETLNLFFNRIKNYLSKNGYFIFDVSLRRNSIKYEKMLNRKGVYKKIKYKQKSEFDEESKIHTNIVFLQFPDGRKYEEVHKQKIYDFYYYFDVMELNDLYVVNCFNAFEFRNGSKNSERVQFVVKRKN